MCVCIYCIIVLIMRSVVQRSHVLMYNDLIILYFDFRTYAASARLHVWLPGTLPTVLASQDRIMQSFKYSPLRDSVSTSGRSDTYLRRSASDIEASLSDSGVTTQRQMDGSEAFPSALLSHSDPCLRIHEPEQGRLHSVLQRMAARRRRQQLQRMPERTSTNHHSAKGKSKSKKGALRTSSSKESGYAKAQRGLGGVTLTDFNWRGRHSPSTQRHSSLDSSGSLQSSDDGSNGSCELLCYGNSPGNSVFHFRRKHDGGGAEATTVQVEDGCRKLALSSQRGDRWSGSGPVCDGYESFQVGKESSPISL